MIYLSQHKIRPVLHVLSDASPRWRHSLQMFMPLHGLDLSLRRVRTRLFILKSFHLMFLYILTLGTSTAHFLEALSYIFPNPSYLHVGFFLRCTTSPWWLRATLVSVLSTSFRWSQCPLVINNNFVYLDHVSLDNLKEGTKSEPYSSKHEFSQTTLWHSFGRPQTMVHNYCADIIIVLNLRLFYPETV